MARVYGGWGMIIVKSAYDFHKKKKKKINTRTHTENKRERDHINVAEEGSGRADDTVYINNLIINHLCQQLHNRGTHECKKE